MAWNPSRALSWRSHEGVPTVVAVDAHTCGEPFRVVLAGAPEIPADTMLAKRRWAEEHLDDLRRALMWEPRGHADMYGGLLTEPERPDSDLGVLFLHNEGFSTMCGHGIIALATVALETGLVEASGERTELRIDTPAGLVRAEAEMREGRVESVAFRNVASFAPVVDGVVATHRFSSLRLDLGYGGAFYAYVEAREIGLGLSAAEVPELVAAAREIKAASGRQFRRELAHPDAEDLGFLYGVLFTGPAENPRRHSRHICVFADGEVDRSPTGTGVSGRLAILARKGELQPGETIEIESVTGGSFAGRVLEETAVGPHPAVVPEVRGSAWITGRNEFVLDPEDGLGGGFLIR